MIKASSQYTPRASSGQFVSVKIVPGLIAGVNEWAKQVYDISQSLVAVDTGELKSSGAVIPAEDTGKTIVGGVRYTAKHAGYVEFGTGIRGAASAGAGKGPYRDDWPGMAAQPYIRPAFDEMKPQAPSILKDAISVTIT